MWEARRSLLVVAALLAPSAAIAQVQVNQTFVPQGPAPDSGSPTTMPPAISNSGAVQALLSDPALGANTMFLGSTNGGIWRTTNGGASWTPLTDNQASLSIASLTLDPTDASGKTLIAGTGATSNGTFPWLGFNQAGLPLRGGPSTGLLYSTNGGNSWSAIGTTTLNGMSVVGVAARGNTILAATFEPKSPLSTTASSGAPYGLYMSTNRGQSFSLVSGLPPGPVTSLVADPTNPNIFYAAVSNNNTVYRGTLTTTGTTSITWTAVSPQFSGGSYLRLAAGPNGSVAAGVIGFCGNPGVTCANSAAAGATVTGLFWSSNSGASWTSIPAPPVSGSSNPTWGQTLNNINQAGVNFALAIDPKTPTVVYVSGDEGPTGEPGPLPIYRINVSGVSGTTCPSTVCALIGGPGSNTLDGSNAHTDSRVIAFNSSGQMILGSDGGIYLQTNPQSNSGQWLQTLNNLQVGESYAVAYGANAKMLLIGRQDNGVAVQSAPNSLTYNSLLGADGHTAAVNDTMLPNFGAVSIFYGGIHFSDDVAFKRLIVNNQGTPISPNGWSGVPVTCSNITGGCASLISTNADSLVFVLNRANPSNIAIAGQNVYIAQDTFGVTATSVPLSLTSVGGPTDTTANVSALAYGIPAANNTGPLVNPNAMLAGVAFLNANGTLAQPNGELWFNADVSRSGAQLAELNAYAGGPPSSVVFDPNSPSATTSPGKIRFYVADGTNLWGGSTQNHGGSFTSLTNNLPAGVTRPTAVEFISANGVNALLVGGLLSPITCNTSPNGCVISSQQSPITVADSDTNGNLSGWRAFGSGLPNVLVTQMSYNPIVDVLAVATVGRGAFTLYDVTSYFPQATVLQFGLANNDSQPDASYLTDGTALGGGSFSRPLNKYGTGTLTIAGAATYTGGTTIYGGVLQLGNGGAGGSILGNVVFCSDAGNSLCDTSTNKMLVFNRSDTYSFDGSISGPGQVVQFGSGRTILTAANTYTGPTYVTGGTLSVNGSTTSSVFVESGGTLGGDGTVGSTMVLAGGVLSPGNSVGTLNVNGNLVFAAASLYLVQAQGSSADRTNVTGTATLLGTVVVSPLSANLARSYSILSAPGGLSGAFDATMAPGLFTATLTYTPTNVQLNLTSTISQIAGLTRNQSAIAAALDNSFNTTGVTFASLFGLSRAQLPAAMDMLSGEGVSGSQETAFGASTMFTSIMMDQGASWRNRETVDVNGVTFAGEPLGYAAEKKSKTSDHPAFKAMPAKDPAIFEQRWRAWLTGFDGTTKLNGEGGIGSATLSHNTGGLAAGLDYQFAPDLLAGFAIGGSTSNFSVRDRITSGNLEGAHFGGYAVKTWREVYAAAALSFSTFRNSETRSIVGIGPTETASGSYGSNLLSGRVEAGWKQSFNWFSVTPFAAVQVSQLWQNAFTETNPPPIGAIDQLGLTYNSKSITSLPTFLGAQFDTRLTFRNAMALTPYVRLSWVHEFMPDRTIGASFIALPAAAFTVDGPRAASDAARVDAGAKLAVAPNAWVFASFNGEFSSRGQSYAGKGGAKVAW
jgi:outer membrane autotransporter protein